MNEVISILLLFDGMFFNQNQAIKHQHGITPANSTIIYKYVDCYKENCPIKFFKRITNLNSNDNKIFITFVDVLLYPV